MNFDSNLKVEIISSLFGRILTHYDRSQGKSKNLLSVDEFHIHNLIGKRKPLAKGLCIDVDEFFDAQFDCDFRDLSDSGQYMRGDEPYDRPEGWYRMALKVKGKYPDGDAWLGTEGRRRHSVRGEWPVSYHGTSVDGAKGIIRSHYKAGERALYGRGIYSTPDIHVAEGEEYAKTFKSKTTGKSYKMILQNRINPKMRQICSRRDYWLVPIRKGASAEVERQIVESSIRPYGILIKEINDDEDDGDGGNNGDGDGEEDYNDQNDDSGDSNNDDDGDDDDGDDDDNDDDDEDDDNDDDDGDDDDDNSVEYVDSDTDNDDEDENKDDCNDDVDDDDGNDCNDDDNDDDDDGDDDDGNDSNDDDDDDGDDDDGDDDDGNDCNDDDNDNDDDGDDDDGNDSNDDDDDDGDDDGNDCNDDDDDDGDDDGNDCNDDDDDHDDHDSYTGDYDGGDLDYNDGYDESDADYDEYDD